MALDRMLKVSDIENNLGISKKKAYMLIATKGFPKIKIGRNYFVPEEQYKKWIVENVKHEIFL